MHKYRPVAQLIIWTGLVCFVTFSWLAGPAGASGPKSDPAKAGGDYIGLASNPLECLTVAGPSAQAGGSVKLNWQGQAERARLIITVAGAEAKHTIRVNGQPVARSPIQPEGSACGEGESFYIPIPLEAVVQGDNQIEISNDALAGDQWSAAMIRLEVLGQIPVPAPKPIGVGTADVSVAGTPFTFSFVNPYDGSTQEARAQIPDGYDGTARPLLVAIHPRSGEMDFGENNFGFEANARGWLLVSPELHGHWPASEPIQPSDPGDYAYASVESQYDTLGAIKYMVNNYNVDYERIYIVGYSMGGQGTVVTAGKSPHLFAAAFDNKGPTDWVQWYNETVDLVANSYDDQDGHRRWMERECHIGGDRKDPTENPFCYQRRSGLSYASNFIHVPLTLTHSISDLLVPIDHSYLIRDAINNNYSPDQLVQLTIDTVIGPTCTDGHPSNPTPFYHCYEPTAVEVLDFFEGHVLTEEEKNPSHINIVTDESKTFYWLRINQGGGSAENRFTRVEVTRSGNTVIALILDTDTLSLDFNLGDDIINDPLTAVPQPGMGLPENRQYLVKQEQGSNVMTDTVAYSFDYLNIPINYTGQVTLTITLIGDSGDGGDGGDGGGDGGDGGDGGGSPGSDKKVYLPVIVK